MKALLLRQYNELDYTDVPDPVPGPDDVLIQVKAVGICGSDVHGLDGSTGRRIPPLIMGHEAAGVIAQAGRAVDAWKAGDRVTFDSTMFCGGCTFCRARLLNLCDQRQVLGVSCEEYRREGAFAEYVAVPARTLYAMPEGLSYEQAAMVEPVSVAVHGVDRLPVRLGDSAVVIGAGIIGLLGVQALRAAGCTCVIAVDIDTDRLRLACELGATATVISSDHAADEVRAITDNRGVELAFEAIGLPVTVKLALECLRKGGSVVQIGNVSPAVEIPLQALVGRQLSLLGSVASCGEYPTCLELMQQGVICVEPLISAVAPLAEGAQWFQRLRNREPGLIKVILQP